MIIKTTETDIEDIRENLAEIGDNLSLMSTLAKSIEVIMENEFDFAKSDIENLLSVLKKFIGDAQKNYDEIDKLLIL